MLDNLRRELGRFTTLVTVTVMYLWPLVLHATMQWRQHECSGLSCR